MEIVSGFFAHMWFSMVDGRGGGIFFQLVVSSSMERLCEFQREEKSPNLSHLYVPCVSPYPSREPRLKTASALIMLLSIVWAYKSVNVHLLQIVFIGKECIGGFSSNRVYFCAFNFFLIFNFFQIFNFFCAKREYQFPECASELLQSLFYFCSSQPLHRLTASYLWVERHMIYNITSICDPMKQIFPTVFHRFWAQQCPTKI